MGALKMKTDRCCEICGRKMHTSIAGTWLGKTFKHMHVSCMENTLRDRIRANKTKNPMSSSIKRGHF